MSPAPCVVVRRFYYVSRALEFLIGVEAETGTFCLAKIVQ